MAPSRRTQADLDWMLMTSAISRPLLPQRNPDCLEQPLPPWLLHDLMQPLNAYGLASEQVRDAIQPALANDAALNLNWEVMDKAIHTQERLLRSLRRFWNLRTDQAASELRPTDLGRIGKQLRSQHDDNSPQVFLQLHGFDDFYVNSQPDRLLELLSCLAENAAVHARSTVTLIASACPEGVRIEVIDDGDGLPPDIIDLLGMPFVRQASGHAAKRKGLGLGIYIAARNAEVLGLALDVSSTRGAGCCFSVTLPLAITTPRLATSISEVDPIAASHILIVDADDQHGRALQQLFASWDCRSDRSPDWNASLAQRVRHGTYDALVISQDIWPQQFTEIDRATYSGPPPFPEIFIIADGHEAPVTDILSNITNRPLHVLRRPLTPSRLRSAMTDALRRRAIVA